MKKVNSSLILPIFFLFLILIIWAVYDNSRADDNVAEIKSQISLRLEELKIELDKDKSQQDSIKIQMLISESINIAQEAVEENPKEAIFWFELGSIYFKINDIVGGAREKAIVCYEKAVELDSDNNVYKQKLLEAQSL